MAASLSNEYLEAGIPGVAKRGDARGVAGMLAMAAEPAVGFAG